MTLTVKQQLEAAIEVSKKKSEGSVLEHWYLAGLEKALAMFPVDDDIVRVVRIYEFSGPRALVEQQVANSIQGEKRPGNGVTIKAATLGLYPELLQQKEL